MKTIKPTKEEKAEIKKELKSWNETIRRLKKKGALITLLLMLLFIGCKKPKEDITPVKHKFQATLNWGSPPPHTLYFDIYATNDSTQYILVKSVSFSELLVSTTFYFEAYIDPNKKIYGASRQMFFGGNPGPFTTKMITIKPL